MLASDTDGGMSTDVLAERAERLAQSYEASIRAAGPAPDQQDTLAQRLAAQSAQTGDRTQQDCQTAALLLAEAELTGEKADRPSALGRSLAALTADDHVDSADKAEIARLLADSSMARGEGPAALGRLLAPLYQMPVAATRDRAAVATAVVDSNYARSLGPATVKFLGQFPGALDRARQAPRDIDAVAQAQFDIFMVEHGDHGARLTGAALDNEVGLAMGLAPNAQPPAAHPATVRNVVSDLYSGKQLDAIQTIARRIESEEHGGGTVTALPVIFDAKGSKNGPQTHVLWRVDSGSSGKSQWVSDDGRTYSDMKDYLQHNKLGYGTLLVPRDGHLALDAGGTIASVVHTKEEGFWHKAGHIAGDVLDGLAIAGAGVLTVAAFVGTDGMAAPLLAAAWSSVLGAGAMGVAKAGADLNDRANHSQYVGLGRETLSDYADIAAGVAAPIGGGATAGVKMAAQKGVALATTKAVQVSAKTAAWAANGVNAGAGGYSGYELADKWDEMSWQQRLQGGATLGLGAVGGAKAGFDVIDQLSLGSSPAGTIQVSDKWTASAILTPREPAPPPPPPVHKIVSWNIAGGRTVRSHGQAYNYGAENREYFSAHLSEVTPDIVCLQESHVSPVTGSLSEKIADDIGLSHVAEVVMHTSPIDPGQKISLAILSRAPIDMETWQLPDPQFPIHINGREVQPLPRNLLVTTVGTTGISVATTHANPDAFLGFDYEHGVGTTHAADLARFFEEQLPSGPLLFAADFNTDNALPLFFPPSVSSHQLQEALPDTPTVPTWGTRPDHIFYTPQFEVVSSGVELTTDADHYMTWASFQALEGDRAP